MPTERTSISSIVICKYMIELCFLWCIFCDSENAFNLKAQQENYSITYVVFKNERHCCTYKYTMSDFAHFGLIAKLDYKKLMT